MSLLKRHFASVKALFIVTLLGLPLISPLLRWTAVACTHDGHLHYHRIAAMRHAWENGLFFTRWLPDLAFGFGYPFFVYREAPPLYAVLLPHLLGLPLPAATNLFYGLCILGAGWFMFLWVRDILGEMAGIVAAVAYMAAPYILVDALIRGNSPESLALPLIPLLLWAGRRWVLGGTAVSFTIATLSLAFFSLSHNISLLIFTPTLLVYLLIIGRVRQLSWKPLLIRIILLFGLGLGMTVFYSAGALLEMDQVTLSNSTTTRNNDFHFNFATWNEILAPVTPENPDLINPPLPFRLGWVAVGLAVLGIIKGLEIGDWRLKKKRRIPQSPISNLQSLEQKSHIVLMVIATAVYLFMALPTSLPVWENLPLIDFVQFPWRFVGRAALPVAFLAGAAFGEIGNWRLKIIRKPPISNLKSLIPLLAIMLLFLETIPNLYPSMCTEESFPTLGTVHAYEEDTGLVGVDPEGSYFPKTVRKRPLPNTPLAADYAAQTTPQRLDMRAIPPGATVSNTAYGKLSVTAQIDSPAPFVAQYLSLDFPGWVAEIDGKPVPITPSDPEGIITFPVPSGTHTISVRWASTPLRTILTGLSILALAGGVVTAVILYLGDWRFEIRDWVNLQSPISNRRLKNLFFLGIFLIIGKFALFDQIETPFRHAAAPAVAHEQPLQAGELRLEGFNLSRETAVSGQTFDIDLAWTAVAPPAAEYQSNIWLADADGLLWSDKETQRPRIYESAPPSIHWQPGQWAWDSREVQILPGTPPGEYEIVLTLFDLATLRPLTLQDVNGGVLGPTAVIGKIQVAAPPTPPEFAPQTEIDATLPSLGLKLLGVNQDRETAVPGEAWLLTLFWERESAQIGEMIELQVQDSANQVVHTWAIPVTPDLQVGQRVRGQHLLRLPASLESGSYRLLLEDVLIGEMALNAPERVFEQPEMETAVDIPFANQINLTGYTLQIQDAQLILHLSWQAVAEMNNSYRVFVHLLDQDGQIIAQADGEPANWTRPTTGWAVGEYILDSHTLSLPDNLPDTPQTLHVGLYDPATGQRLTTETTEFAIIPLTK